MPCSHKTKQDSDPNNLTMVLLLLTSLLNTLLLCPTGTDAVDVIIRPVTEAVGADSVFHIHLATTMIALLALVARQYEIDAERILLLFRGRMVQGENIVSRIEGFQDGDVMLLVVRRTPAGGAVTHPDRIPPAVTNQTRISDMQQLHGHNWSRIANRETDNWRNNDDPTPPDIFELEYILTVAYILTENIPGVIDCPGFAGLPGPENFNENLIMAILFYYQHRREHRHITRNFVEFVYDQLQGLPGENETEHESSNTTGDAT